MMMIFEYYSEHLFLVQIWMKA